MSTIIFKVKDEVGGVALLIRESSVDWKEASVEVSNESTDKDGASKLRWIGIDGIVGLRFDSICAAIK